MRCPPRELHRPVRALRRTRRRPQRCAPPRWQAVGSHLLELITRGQQFLGTRALQLVQVDDVTFKCRDTTMPIFGEFGAAATHFKMSRIKKINVVTLKKNSETLTARSIIDDFDLDVAKVGFTIAPHERIRTLEALLAKFVLPECTRAKMAAIGSLVRIERLAHAPYSGVCLRARSREAGPNGACADTPGEGDDLLLPDV